MSDVAIDIEVLLCAGHTHAEIVERLDVPVSWVKAVWDQMMQEMVEMIANPPPRMTDAEYDQMVAEMHGDD